MNKKTVGLNIGPNMGMQMSMLQQNSRTNDHETPESIRSGCNQGMLAPNNYYGHIAASEV
jgi:hypothetical protein